MKQDWHPGELAQHWTLSTDEAFQHHLTSSPA